MSRAGLVRHGVTKNVSVDENYVVKVFYALPDGCTLNLVAGIFFRSHRRNHRAGGLHGEDKLTFTVGEINKKSDADVVDIPEYDVLEVKYMLVEGLAVTVVVDVPYARVIVVEQAVNEGWSVCVVIALYVSDAKGNAYIVGVSEDFGFELENTLPGGS